MGIPETILRYASGIIGTGYLLYEVWVKPSTWAAYFLTVSVVVFAVTTYRYLAEPPEYKVVTSKQ